MNPRQTRLSLVMGVVAALGTAAILWAWWDSMKHYMVWVSHECKIASTVSEIVILVENHGEYPDGFRLGFNRARKEDS